MGRDGLVLWGYHDVSGVLNEYFLIYQCWKEEFSLDVSGSLDSNSRLDARGIHCCELNAYSKNSQQSIVLISLEVSSATS